MGIKILLKKVLKIPIYTQNKILILAKVSRLHLTSYLLKNPLLGTQLHINHIHLERKGCMYILKYRVYNFLHLSICAIFEDERVPEIEFL